MIFHLIVLSWILGLNIIQTEPVYIRAPSPSPHFTILNSQSTKPLNSILPRCANTHRSSDVSEVTNIFHTSTLFIFWIGTHVIIYYYVLSVVEAAALMLNGLHLFSSPYLYLILLEEA